MIGEHENLCFTFSFAHIAKRILIFGFRLLVSMLELRTGVLLLDTGGFSVLTSNNLCVFQASEFMSPSCVAQSALSFTAG